MNHSLLKSTLIVAITATLAACAGAPPASSGPTLSSAGLPAYETKETQAKVSPDMALQRLKDGNQRFVAGKMIQRDLKKQVDGTSHGQYPFASVISCMDSRSGPETVFDQGIGDIFTTRVAGNFVNDDILGSLEYGSKVAGSRLIVVLGHSSCGAVKGACDNVKLGNLTQLLQNIKPAVDAVPETGDRSSKNYAFVERVAEANVKRTMNQIVQRSPVLKEMIDKGEVKLVGAMLDVHSGKVSWY